MSIRIVTLLCAFICSGAFAGTLTTNHNSAAPDGSERYYDLYIPDNLPPASPLVVLLHGATYADSTVFNSSDPASVWKSVADQNGVIVVAPNGTNPLSGKTDSSSAYWNDCTGETVVGKDTADDVGFIRALVSKLVATYGVDPSQVYATGMSNGAMMALRLGREAGDVFAAIESTSGLDPRSAQDQCHDLGVAEPLMLVQGDADTLVNYKGNCPLLGICFSSFDQTVAAWLARNGATGAIPTDAPVPPSGSNTNNTSVDCKLYPGQTSVAVEACTVHNGGHTEPSILVSLGLSQLVFGSQNRDLETAKASWQFFAAHKHQ